MTAKTESQPVFWNPYGSTKHDHYLLKIPENNQKLVRACSIWRALEIVGDTPTLLIMQSYWLGVRRFDDFCQQTGLLKSLVSNRLKRLIDNECMIKVRYSDRPVRYEYKATERFIDFFPLALAMLHWERKWCKKKNAINVILEHTECHYISEPFPACSACGEAVNPRDVIWRPGPGVGMMDARYSPRRRQTTNAIASTRLFDEIVSIVGDRWSTLILRSLFMGVNQFQSLLDDTGIATNILTDRINQLTHEEILYPSEVSGDQRQIKYRLTEKGSDIYPIIILLLVWGDKWQPAPEGPPLLLTHRSCGGPLVIRMVCSSCNDTVDATATQFTVEDSH